VQPLDEDGPVLAAGNVVSWLKMPPALEVGDDVAGLRCPDGAVHADDDELGQARLAIQQDKHPRSDGDQWQEDSAHWDVDVEQGKQTGQNEPNAQ
jgi:hypothetical protein